MKIYITARYKGSDNKNEIEDICQVVRRSGFEDFCFICDVENYQKIFNNGHELMQRSKDEIEKCDALLIDYDGPASGRMIELGMAYAMNKKIILIVKKGMFVKETVVGVADTIIEYEKLEEIIAPMSKLLTDWKRD